MPGEYADGKSLLEENSADEIENWYNDSDTADDIPDPNQKPECLYQDVNTVPVKLRPSHFEEGLLYTITLRERSTFSMLVMVIETNKTSFLYRTFFYRGSSRKTYHEGAKDKSCPYRDV